MNWGVLHRHCGASVIVCVTNNLSGLNLLGLQGLGARTKRVPSMFFRDHPLMRYRGVPSWPPDWAGQPALKTNVQKEKAEFSDRLLGC